MNDGTIKHFPSACIHHSFFLDICIHYEYNMPHLSTKHLDFTLWLGNLEYKKILLNLQFYAPELPKMRMNSERHKRSSSLRYIISLWSLQVSPSVALEQVFVVFRLSFGLIAAEPPLYPKSGAAGDVRICPSKKNHNFFSLSSSGNLKANPLWWPKFIKRTNQPSGKRSRLPLSIAYSRAMGGSRPRRIVHLITIETIPYECFDQTFHLYWAACPTSCRLVNFFTESSGLYSHRSYRCALGGYC